MPKSWRWKWPLAAAGAIGIVVGIIGWGGFHTAMEMTNTLGFCTSCHEMGTVYKEYQASIHYANASGVRAICSDCHVPREWAHKVVRKIQATNELYHKVAGTIDTPEKFEAQRLTLARHVWESMKETDSRECRNCHSFQAMNFHNQKPEAAKAMQKAMTDGSTCIDCHKGIAHKLPDMTTGFRSMFDDLQVSGKALNPTAGDTVYTLSTIPFFLEMPAADAAGGDGKLLALTPLKVLERSGDQVRVEIDGWQQEGAERMLYALKGKRIFSAALGPDAVDKVVKGAAGVDPDTGQNWSEGKISGWVKLGGLVKDQDKLRSYGEEMFNASCGLCHAAPSTSNYLANQWIGTLNAMKRFVSLDEEQYRFLQKFVQLHAKDTGGAQ